jgi:hypothetical protein
MGRTIAILARVMPAGRKVVVLLAALVLVSGSGASAGKPWQLHCASLPAEQRAPAPVRAATLQFFAWVRPAARALHAGPVYLVALSTGTAIWRDGDDADSSGYYLHRALLAIAPTYAGALTVSGHRLGHSIRPLPCTRRRLSSARSSAAPASCSLAKSPRWIRFAVDAQSVGPLRRLGLSSKTCPCCIISTSSVFVRGRSRAHDDVGKLPRSVYAAPRPIPLG